VGAELYDDGHYTLDVVGAQLGLPGAGLHAYFTRDLLHPPMVPDASMWADGRQWWQGSIQHTIDVGRLAELRDDDHVLDVGCGLGGPARVLVHHYGVWVTSVTNSVAHAATCQRLNNRSPHQRDRIRVVLADGQRQLPAGPFDAAISINMLYQVPNHRAIFARVFDRLAAGGRFVIDDWMLTPLATQADVDRLVAHFQYPYFARTDRVETDLMATGFPTAETIVDFGHIARGPMAEHFERQIQTYFAPRVIADWPDDPVIAPGRPAYGRMMIDEFVQAVNVTLELHRRCHMTYRRVLVRKPS